MNYADEIKSRLKMPEVLRYYGFDIKRGRIPCPIHSGSDRNCGVKDEYIHCFVCGAKFSNEWDGYKYNGIDRVDNEKGYEEGNVVPCCKICNVAKHDMEQKDFIFWARSVAEHTKNLFLDGE